MVKEDWQAEARFLKQIPSSKKERALGNFSLSRCCLETEAALCLGWAALRCNWAAPACPASTKARCTSLTSVWLLHASAVGGSLSRCWMLGPGREMAANAFHDSITWLLSLGVAGCRCRLVAAHLKAALESKPDRSATCMILRRERERFTPFCLSCIYPAMILPT